MKVCLGEIHGKPAMLELKDDQVYLDNELVPIKNLTASELAAFQQELDGLPTADAEAHAALANSVRAAFLAQLLGKAVGDECISKIQHILDHVHYDVLKYLGEAE